MTVCAARSCDSHSGSATTSLLLRWQHTGRAELDSGGDGVAATAVLLQRRGDGRPATADADADAEACGLTASTLSIEYRLILSASGVRVSFAAPLGCFRGCWVAVGRRAVAELRVDGAPLPPEVASWDPLAAAIPRPRLSAAGST